MNKTGTILKALGEQKFVESNDKMHVFITRHCTLRIAHDLRCDLTARPTTDKIKCVSAQRKGPTVGILK